MASHRSRHAYQVNLPITTTSRWESNVVGNGKLKFSTPDDLFRFDASWTKPGERWAYPRFVLKENPARASAVLLRARILKPGRNVAVMMMQSGKPGFWSLEVMPADGDWHVCYVPFADMQARPGNPDLQNSLPDPAKFTGIQVGTASNEQENAMEVSHLMIVGK